jgi:hypothetical protein
MEGLGKERGREENRMVILITVKIFTFFLVSSGEANQFIQNIQCSSFTTA